MKKILILIILILNGCSLIEDKKTYYKCEGLYGVTGPLFKSNSEPIDFSLVLNWTKKTYLVQDWVKIQDFNNINNGQVKTTDIQVSSVDNSSGRGFEFDIASGELNILLNQQSKGFHGFCKVVQPKI